MRTIIAITFFFLLATTCFGQMQQTIPIYLDGPGFHDTVYIGTNNLATFCADSALGEVPSQQLPAPPVGHLQLINPRSGGCWRNPWGQDYRIRSSLGQAIDLRPVSGQIDTFVIWWPEGGGTLSWGNMSSAYHGSVRLSDGDLLNLDMKQTNTLDLSVYTGGVRFHIIANQAAPGPVPNLTEIGASILVLAFGLTGMWLVRRRLRNRISTAV